MRYYVIINGVNSLTIEGLAIRTLPPISKPAMRNLREEIDGRDGDITTELGYGAYDRPLEIGLYGDYDINRIISFFNTKGTIIFSDEPDKYYNFEIVDKIDYTKLVKFRTASINIHCQPFKYSTEEEPEVEEYEYVEATGTNVTLDNTSEAIFNKIDLLGNTEQTQYTGANILDVENLTTQTLTAMATIQKGNNYIHGTTTATEWAGLQMVCTLTAGTYYYKHYTKLNSANTNTLGLGSFRLNKNSQSGELVINQNLQATYVNRMNEQTFTIPTDGTYVFVYRFGNATATERDIELQDIILSKTDVPYEPYVGNVPSPNPSFPQPIHVVSGDNTIKITGRNLFQITQSIHISNGVTTTFDEEGKAHLTGTTSSTWANITNNYNLNLPAGTYTMSTTDIINHTLGFKGNYEDGSLFEFVIYSGNRSRTFTTTKGLKNGYFYVGGLASGATINETITPQVEHGSTRHDYQKYVGEEYPLTLGVKNLWNSQDFQLGYLPMTGQYPTQNSQYPNSRYVLVHLLAGQSINLYRAASTPDFRVRYINPNTNLIVGTIRIGDNDGWATSNIDYSTGWYNGKITALKEVILGLWDYNGNINSGEVTIGETRQTISDTPIEMASIPNTNYRDVFVKDNDIWYKRQVINKQIFNGDSSMLWGVNSNWDTTAPALLHIFTNSLNNLWEKGQNGFLSNRFTCTTEAQRDFAKEMVTCHTTNTTPYFFIKFDRLTGVTSTSPVAEKITAFNNWLRSNNTELLYLAAEETDIEITNETLIDQLEAIKNAISYSGQTNVSQTNNDMPFILELSALKEGSDHLVINNAGNIYAKPTMDLEGTGVVDIYLNDVQILEADLTETNNIVIDTEAMEAYNPDTNALANRQITGDYSKIKLEPGDNDLRFSGDLSKATITDYTRWL